MIEQKDITIGEEKMVIQSLSATEALRVLSTLARISGGAWEGVSDIPSSSKEVEEAMHLGKMVNGLLSKIDPIALPKFLKGLFKLSLIRPDFQSGQTSEEFDNWFDIRFSQKLDEMVSLFSEIFTFNFGDPIDWVKKIWARVEESGLIERSAPLQTETEQESSTQN